MDVNQLQRLKLSVAIACLSTKPEGMSGEEHAQRLCNKYQLDQLHWKEKYQAAATELLHLKQAEFLRSQEELDDQGFRDSQPLFPTPPPSGNPAEEPKIISFLSTQQSLSKHTAFLQSVLSLRTASKLSTSKSIHKLTEETLKHCLETILNYFSEEENKASISSLGHCINCIMDLMDKSTASVYEEIQSKVKDIVSAAADGIISQKVHNVMTLQRHKLVISKFSNNQILSPIILDILMDRIQTFSSHLRKVSIEEISLDPGYYLNMHHITSAFEEVLQQTRTMNFKIVEKLSDRLKDSLLHLTQTFPLFAHALWRIESLLNKLQ